MQLLRLPFTSSYLELESSVGAGLVYGNTRDQWYPGLAINGAFRFPITSGAHAVSMSLRFMTIHSPSTVLGFLLPPLGDRKHITGTLGIDVAL